MGASASKSNGGEVQQTLGDGRGGAALGDFVQDAGPLTATGIPPSRSPTRLTNAPPGSPKKSPLATAGPWSSMSPEPLKRPKKNRYANRSWHCGPESYALAAWFSARNLLIPPHPGQLRGFSCQGPAQERTGLPRMPPFPRNPLFPRPPIRPHGCSRGRPPKANS
jgi:hypothetical protein